MDDYSPAFRDYSVPTPSEQSLPAFTPKRPTSVPQPVKRIILELSLRFQPTDEAKRQAFNDKVALLATDCAHVPHNWLAVASREWIETGDGFLPTASSLIRLAQQAQAKTNASTPSGNAYKVSMDMALSYNPRPETHMVWVPKREGGIEFWRWQDFQEELRRDNCDVRLADLNDVMRDRGLVYNAQIKAGQ